MNANDSDNDDDERPGSWLVAAAVVTTVALCLSLLTIGTLVVIVLLS
jgi:hypothetical protein